MPKLPRTRCPLLYIGMRSGEEIAELAEQFGEEGVEENLLEDEGEGVKFKPRK